jgi:hypothetical protein
MITYFPLIRHGPHRKRRFQQFFMAAGTCLPSRCLATIGEYTVRPTDFPLIRHGPYRTRCLQQYFYFCLYSVSAVPLPSNYKGIHIQTHRPMGGIYEVRRWDGLRCHDLHTKFHKDWVRHSEVYRRGYTDTQTVRWSHKPTFIVQNKESRPKIG